MKKILIASCIALSGLLSHAQNGLEQIIVEKYYISNAADSLQADAEIVQYNTDNGTTLPIGALPVGSVTYRVYADLLPGWKILTVYADHAQVQNGGPDHPLKFGTTTSFYNNPYGTQSPVPGTTKTAIKNNLLALDTYYSLGAVCTGNLGILKSEDNGLLNNITSASNPAGVLLNADAAAGIALTTQDGMIAGTGIATASTAGFTPANEAVFNDGTILSNSFTLIDGSWYTSVGAMGPIPADNKVLIAQLTTNGSLSFELNIQAKDNATGSTKKFVAKDPNPSTDTSLHEIQIPSLVYPLVANPPTVSILTPTNNKYFVVGDIVALSADAKDLDGTISSVEFSVDGGSAITAALSTGSTYTASYTYTAGTHTITAKATDNSTLSTTSSAVIIVQNQAPVVDITNPLAGALPFKLDSVISLTAIASDPNSNGGGTISSVQFFIDAAPVGTATLTPYAVTYTCTAGTHTVTAIATDDKGASTTSAAVTFTVTSGYAPTVSITSPVSNSTLYYGDVLSINASASDVDGTVSSVEFFLGTTSLGVDASAPYSINYTLTTPVGLQCFTAKATDNANLVTTSTQVCVNVMDTTTGIYDHNLKEVFTVYPNPAQNNLSIEINKAKSNNNSYILYGIVGNVIAHKELGVINSKHIETIDISSLANGQYILTVTIDGASSSKMIIKN